MKKTIKKVGKGFFSDKKKMVKLLIIVLVLIVVVILTINYFRARKAESALNSETTQQAIARDKELQAASEEQKKEILNATMTTEVAKNTAEIVRAAAMGHTNQSEQQQIADAVYTILNAADLALVTKAYSKGKTRGGRGFIAQVKYELSGKKWKSVIDHLIEINGAGI